MKYFKTIVRYGHVGNNHDVEVTRFLAANNVVEIMDITRKLPAAKKKSRGKSLITSNEISYAEYLEGLEAEKNDHYLQNILNINVSLAC